MPSTVYKKIFEEKWPSEVGGVILALLNTLMFLYSGPISATTAVIADWGRWVYKISSMDPESPVHFLQTSRYFPQHMLYIGLMIGVVLSTLFAKQFSIKRERAGGYVQGFIGGALMGIGGFLAGACLFSGLWSGIMGLSLSGFVTMAGLLAGAFFGSKFVMWQINRQAERLFSPDAHKRTTSKDNAVRKDYRHLQPGIAITGALIIATVISIDMLVRTGFPTAAFVFGIFFGIVFQRSAFCFAAAFREVFVTRTSRMMRSLIISLAVGVTGFTVIMAAGLKPTESSYAFSAGWNIFLGSVIFGFGMTITGG